MKKFSLFLVAFSTIFFLFQTAAAIPIDIFNPSFEEKPENIEWVKYAPGPYFTDIVDWNISEDQNGSSATWQPEMDHYPEVTNGSNVAALNGGFISQTLVDTLTAGYIYTLEAWVGHRALTPFPGYSVELWAGDYFLKKEDSLKPKEGEFLLSSLNFTAPDVHDAFGEHLTIKLWSNGLQVNFDNVFLDVSPITILPGKASPSDFTASPAPEPATMLLVGTGLIGLVGLGRKRFSKKEKNKGQGYKANISSPVK
jgi:hypothetical protein